MLALKRMLKLVDPEFGDCLSLNSPISSLLQGSRRFFFKHPEVANMSLHSSLYLKTTRIEGHKLNKDKFLNRSYDTYNSLMLIVLIVKGTAARCKVQGVWGGSNIITKNTIIAKSKCKTSFISRPIHPSTLVISYPM